MVAMMNRTGTFGPSEAIILLAVANIARVFLPFPRYLNELGANAAWLTPLGGLLVALLGFYIMYLVLKSGPDLNIVQITERTLGPYLGTLLNLVTVGFFIAVGSLFTREFAEALIVSALPSVPISVVSILYMAMGMLGAYLGIEALARTSRLAYPFIFGGILLLLLAVLPMSKLDNIFPIFGSGPLQVFGIGTLSTASVTEIIFAGVIIQSLGGLQHFRLVGYRAMLLSFATLTAVLLLMNLSFHWLTMGENTLPFYSMSRDIYIGRFLQRVEAVFILIWGMVAFIKIALTLYGAAVALTGTLKLPDYRPLLWPLVVIMFILSVLPPDLPSAIQLDINFLRPFSNIPNYILPLLILAVYKLRRGKRGEV
jgi:spore germination protein KB